MLVLGIDPGTAKMGYALVDASNTKMPKLIETNVLITSPDSEQHHRLHILYTALRRLTKEHNPKVMVIERLFFNTNAKTAITVGQARGISMLVAADKKMDLFEYTALEAKLVLTGYGRSDKKQMQVAVKDLLQLPSIVKSDDANDAVAIALCFIKKDYSKYVSSR